ncbi:MAG: 4Fe-4S binding protein, partial [Actinobacteria bacterium]|nr:4Fe-4S binding protein [Actinomycetota bacterium]
DCINEDCDRCAICQKSCPVDAISMTPFPEIDRDRCIECYCCNEMCPTGAMQIKKSWLAALVSGKV